MRFSSHSAAQSVAPYVRRGRVLAGLRADLRRIQAWRGDEETKLLVDHVTTMLALILFVVTLVGIIAAPILVYISAPGFVKDAEKFELTVQLLRITSPYIFFISLVAVAAGILNTYNKFWVPAFAPILLNVCFIGGALWLAPYCNPPIMALAWAVVRRRHRAAGVPASVPEKNRHVAGDPFQPERRRHVARHQADGSGGVRRFHQPDQPDHQHHLRVVLVAGRRVLAVLRGSADGVSFRFAGRGAGHDTAALAIQMPRQQQHGGIFQAARLGLGA